MTGNGKEFSEETVITNFIPTIAKTWENTITVSELEFANRFNHLLDVYGEVSVKWVSDQLLAIRKIFWKRKQPLTFAVFDGPPEHKPPVNIKFPNMRILHCRNYVDEEKLLNFIESLAKERTI